MEHFQVNELVKLNNEIDELYAKLTADPTIIYVNDIDTAVNSLNNILHDSAKNAGFYLKKKRLKNQDTGANNVTGKFKQPWFNQNCHKLRKKFRNAKNNYIRRKTSQVTKWKWLDQVEIINFT